MICTMPRISTLIAIYSLYLGMEKYMKTMMDTTGIVHTNLKMEDSFMFKPSISGEIVINSVIGAAN